MIELDHVSRIYRTKTDEIHALDDVSLTVQDGEFVAVCGPSGSGKSTLLLTIAGMNRPTEGHVRIDGADIYSQSGGRRARFRASNVGFVFQMFHLAPYLNAIENVLLPTQLVGGNDRTSRARELLERFGMDERMTHKPGALSTGERQRTAVARAMINDPWLLLADEPTGNLDPETSQEILGYVTEFNENGGTVIVVSHEPSIRDQVSSTIYLRKGRLTQDPA